jgi:hypothetical protein
MKMRQLWSTAVLSLALATALPVRAHGGSADLSALSFVPVAVSVAAPVMVLSGGAYLTVVAVHASAEGATWILENAADGARASVKFASQAAGGASVAVGTAVTVSAITAGYVLSAAGTVIAFIPNEIGKALLYSQRLTH